MKTQIVRNTEEFDLLGIDWKRIETIDPDVSFYSRFEAAKAWWDAHQGNPHLKLWIITVWDTVKIVGIAPLIIMKSGNSFFSWRTVRLLGMGDYLGILIDRNFPDQMTIIKEIMHVIEERQEEWDRVFLEYIPSRSLLAAYLLKSKYNRYFKYLVECPVINIEDYHSFSNYQEYFMPTNVQRIRKKLQKNTEYQLKVERYSSEVLDQIIELHKKEQRYLAREKKRKEQESIFEDESTLNYIKNVFQKCPENVILFTLVNAQTPIIAYGACWLYNDTLHWWNCGYDPEYEKYSPVKALILEMIQYFFENKMARLFDFGAGRYFWKFEWTNDFIFNYQLDMINTRRRLFLWSYKIKKALNVMLNN